MIVNCNDVLYNFKKCNAEKQKKETEYKMRYSDIGAIRTWVYLQLEFTTETFLMLPIRWYRYQTWKHRQLPHDHTAVLIDSLTICRKPALYRRLSNRYHAATTVDGYSTNKFFINKKIFYWICICGKVSTTWQPTALNVMDINACRWITQTTNLSNGCHPTRHWTVSNRAQDFQFNLWW